jgi:hypothetical protein
LGGRTPQIVWQSHSSPFCKFLLAILQKILTLCAKGGIIIKIDNYFFETEQINEQKPLEKY